VTLNDLLSAPKSYLSTSDTGDTLDITSGRPCRLFRAMLTNGTATLRICNALTVTGGTGERTEIKITGTDSYNYVVNFGEAGLRFETGLSINLSAAASLLLIYALE